MHLLIQINRQGSISKIVVVPSDPDTAVDGGQSEAPNSDTDLYGDGIGLQHQKPVAEAWEKGSVAAEHRESPGPVDSKHQEETGPKQVPITERDIKHIFPRGEYAHHLGLFVEDLLASGYVLVRDGRGFSIDYPAPKGGFQVTVGWIAPPGKSLVRERGTLHLACGTTKTMFHRS